MQYSKGKSALVFCSTRKGAQEAAQRLSQIAMTFGLSNPFIKSRESRERLREASLSCSDKQMQSYILFGVGYHNGGLCPKDRNLIEGLFLNGDLQILCATNTLAHGINLPAHTVVIKSTQHFNKEKGLYMEYDRSMIQQMCGRAGRPPFDDTGMVIIMTRRETVHLYENLLNGCEMVESQLLSCVTEHLTAEIVQLTVSDITRAIEWMKCSYLYVRMKKNPENYAIKKGIPNDRIEKHMQEICVQKVNELSQYQLIWTDDDGFLVKPLEPGRLMTKYYLKFGTMKHIMQAPSNCSVEDALYIICRAEEIAWIQLRRNDKKLLNDINGDKDGRLRFHILVDKGKKKKRIQTREEKIFVLANDCLTGDPLVHDLSMSQDTNSICANGCRIAKCMKEYFIYRKNYKGALNSTLLAKSLHQKLWDDSPYLLKQLPGIGMVTAKALHSMGVKSFETLSEADPRKIEIVTGRKFPFGSHIKESLLSLPPKVEMKIEECECQRQGKSKIVVTLTRLTQLAQSTKRHYAEMVVGLEEDNLILFHEKIRLDEFTSPYSATILLSTPQQGSLIVKADLILEEFIGIDLHRKLLVTKEIESNVICKRRSKPPSYFPQPRNVCVLENDNDCTSKVPAEVVQNSNHNKAEIYTIPSFNLLDEDLEEGVPAVDAEDDDCKIITERTVFDHIREKAKNFPVVPTSTIPCSPLSENLLLIRKRNREKQIAFDDLIDVFEEADRNRIPRRTLAIPSSEPRGSEQDRHDIRKDATPNRHITSRSMYHDAGKHSPECEQGVPQSLNGETIFEHIRRKAKNLPMIDTLKTVGSEAFGYATEVFTENQPEFKRDMFKESIFNEVLRDSVITLDSDPREMKNTAGANDLCSDIGLTSSRITSSKVPFLKTESRMEQYFSPSSSGQHCRSLATSAEIRDVDSFLGFKSVFSFL